VLVQADQALAGLEALLDGLITNGKFCCVRHVGMDLTWWHRPLRLRRSALQADAALPGASHDPDLDRLPPAQLLSQRRPPVGSGCHSHWCAAGMVEAAKQFRRVNGYLHLPALRAALEAEAAGAVTPACEGQEVVEAA
jgi:hypothetical protein